jgi:hypothetical protein
MHTRRRRGRPIRATLPRQSSAAAAISVVALVSSLAAAPAPATTFCVPAFDPARCPDNGENVEQANLETAMQSEANDGIADRIVIAPGTYTDTNSFDVAGADLLTIEGAGAGDGADPGATRLTTSSGSGVIVVNLANSAIRPIAMRDLTVVVPATLPDDTGAAMQIRADTLERVDIEIANPGADGLASTPDGGVYRDGAIYAVGGGSIRDAIATGTPGTTGQLMVEGARIVEPVAGVVSEEAGMSVSVERTVIERPTEYALRAWKGGALNVRNSIVLIEGNAVALEARSNTADDSSASGDHLTIVQESAGMGTGVSSRAESAAETDLLLENSIMRGFAFPYVRIGSGAPADLTIRYSNFEPTGTSLVMGALDIAQGNVDADPLFAAPPPYGAPAGLALGAGSPSIDAGNPAPGGLPGDFLGTARPRDGNGDGIAIRDQGALELPGLPVGPAGVQARRDTSVGIRILGKRLVLNRRGIARLRLRCPAAEASPPCRGRVLVRTRARLRFGKRKRARPLMLAGARFRIAAGRTRAVRLRVRGGRLRLLRRSGRARRVVTLARVRDGAGNRTTARRFLRVVFGGRRR